MSSYAAVPFLCLRLIRLGDQMRMQVDLILQCEQRSNQSDFGVHHSQAESAQHLKRVHKLVKIKGFDDVRVGGVLVGA